MYTSCLDTRALFEASETEQSAIHLVNGNSTCLLSAKSPILIYILKRDSAPSISVAHSPPDHSEANNSIISRKTDPKRLIPHHVFLNQ